MNAESPRLRVVAAIAALVGWSALILKLVLVIRAGVDDGRGGVVVIAYFVSFAVGANILAAAALTSLIAPRFALGRFFSRPAECSAVATVMASVAIAYTLLIRPSWHPQGWQLVADEGLHSVMPALVLTYWWLAVPRGALRWADIQRWTIYPVVYFVFLILRGAFTGLYPYHIVDVGLVGVGRVLVNAAGALIAYAVVAAALVAAKRNRAI